MFVHRRIRIFQLHNSKIPETPRPKTLKEGKRVAATTTLHRRICNFQLLILRFQNPCPSKTLTDKAQQQQRFSTVSLRVFFFLALRVCIIKHFCCYICIVAGLLFKQEEAQEQEEGLHHHHEVCHVIPVFCFFVFFFSCCGLGSWCSPCKRVLFQSHW